MPHNRPLHQAATDDQLCWMCNSAMMLVARSKWEERSCRYDPVSRCLNQSAGKMLSFLGNCSHMLFSFRTSLTHLYVQKMKFICISDPVSFCGPSMFSLTLYLSYIPSSCKDIHCAYRVAMWLALKFTLIGGSVENASGKRDRRRNVQNVMAQYALLCSAHLNNHFQRKLKNIKIASSHFDCLGGMIARTKLLQKVRFSIRRL